jgi:hypothetical protein
MNELVVPSHFIQAVRESGYLTLSTALAELVDNAIQAHARNIAIKLERPEGSLDPEIEVVDDGDGMNRQQLGACLRFGGSSRFGQRESFGRFGLGLPAASLSQARRVEVVTWQQGGPRYEVALDVDAITMGGPTTLAPRRVGESASKSGCTVIWRVCDRIEYRRLGWLERVLRRDLGRMYRRFLEQGLILTINGATVEIEDPLMFTKKVEGATASTPFEPLEFELRAVDGTTAPVRATFSILPVNRWHRLDNLTKRRLGIVGGGGVSILRAGREIAYGWHLMGGKRKENYDDWWRCEIEFDPKLDEHFGITINKQGIRPSSALREALEPELESIARLLNVRVRRAFEEVHFAAATEASCKIAAEAEPDLPVMSKGRVTRYSIRSEPLASGAMFRHAIKGGSLDVTLNADHPAFAALYGPLASMDTEAATRLRTAVELFLLSFARSAATANDYDRAFDDLLASWSSTYGRMLQKA